MFRLVWAGAALIGTLAAASPARLRGPAYQFRKRGVAIASLPGEYSIVDLEQIEHALLQ